MNKDILDKGTMVDAALFSSECAEWGTPQALFDQLDREFNFTLDPAASHENHKCARYFTKEDDGLAQSWQGGAVYVNPPYGRHVGDWVFKALVESENVVVVMLLPARTDTKWWHDYVMLADEIRFIRGRLTFEGAKNTAPFPSVVVVFRGWGGPPAVYSMGVPRR